MIKIQLSNAKYQLLLDNIESYFANSDIILQDGRNTIKEVEFEQKIFIVKSFKKPIFINRLIYSYFRPSKAKRAYNFGLRIAKFTPKVTGFIAFYKHTLLNKSFFICEKYSYDFDFRTPLFDNNFPFRQLIFKQFADFVYGLHLHQIIHQDLSPGNILIKKKEQGYEFKIVDINRMIFKSPNFKKRAKIFNKLWANDDDLSLILSEYAKLAGFGDNFINLGLKYNNQYKKQKTRKRKIKKMLRLC